MTSRERLKRKEVEDVLGGEETWKDADSTSGGQCISISGLIQLLLMCHVNSRLSKM